MIINRGKLKIVEIQTAEIEECLYYVAPLIYNASEKASQTTYSWSNFNSLFQTGDR
jgi:hypothetical protein